MIPINLKWQWCCINSILIVLRLVSDLVIFFLIVAILTIQASSSDLGVRNNSWSRAHLFHVKICFLWPWFRIFQLIWDRFKKAWGYVWWTNSAPRLVSFSFIRPKHFPLRVWSLKPSSLESCSIYPQPISPHTHARITTAYSLSLRAISTRLKIPIYRG